MLYLSREHTIQDLGNPVLKVIMAQDRGEYMKTYRANNKDKYKEYRKNWREKHKQDEDYKLKQAAYSRHYYTISNTK